MRKRGRSGVVRSGFSGLFVVAGASLLALCCFLVLPFIQAITEGPEADLDTRLVDSTSLPPPPPPPQEQEPEEPEEEEEEPPQLEEEAAPLDLSQLELALNPGFSDSWLGGDFAVKLSTSGSTGESLDALFSMADLEQEPRPLYQPMPSLDAKMRKKLPASVSVLFVIDEKGRVEKAVVQRSSDPLFERATLAAVKQWKFEPGKRNGKPVRVRRSIPITFPKED